MISLSDLEDIFASGGKLSRRLPSYENRPDQLSMAEDVARCYNENRKGVIEAGTGIGKSYAYLAVALLNAQENSDEKTVIATSNVALQQQLINKDLPTLESALDLDIPYALLLGRNRYVCVSKMLNAVSGFRNREAKLFEEAETAEDKIYSWFRSTETGIMEELEHKLLRTSFAANIRSDKDTCLKQRCPHIGKCFYYNAIQKAKNSRLIVTNHALLFIDSYIRAAGDEGFDESVIIPPYNRLIIDECHNIDKSATEFFSLSLSEERVRESYRKLFSITYKNKNNMHLADIITTYKKEITADDARAFNVNLTQFTSEVCIYLKTLVSARDRQLFVSECLVTDTQENFDAVRKDEAAQLLITLDEILKAFRFFLQGLDKNCSDEDEIYINLASGILGEYEEYHDVLLSFYNHGTDDSTVCYYKFRPDEEGVTMCVSPVSIAGRMNDFIFSKLDTVVCTSATVKTGKNFNYFLKQVGLGSGSELVTGFYPSPFDYSRNAMLLFPVRGNFMRFDAQQKDSYAEYLAHMIEDCVNASGGSALVLFTSKDMMERVYALVKDNIEMPLLIQKTGTSTNLLRKKFLTEKNSILFGLRSFWEGIDVPGDALRLLIITQLPFPHIQDCIMRARSQLLMKEEKSPFLYISVPEMLITLKQGLGRLIRSESDRGVVIIADGRTSRYIEAIRNCLPPYYIPDEEALDVTSFAGKIENFLF